MNPPTLLPTRRVGPDTDLIGTHVPLPGLGLLPINAYLIHAREPVLVDTGIGALGDDFVAALSARIDPADLRWIWLTWVWARAVRRCSITASNCCWVRLCTSVWVRAPEYTAYSTSAATMLSTMAPASAATENWIDLNFMGAPSAKRVACLGVIGAPGAKHECGDAILRERL